MTLRETELHLAEYLRYVAETLEKEDSERKQEVFGNKSEVEIVDCCMNKLIGDLQLMKKYYLLRVH